MKVAVIKLGSRISFNANDTSGGNGEARSIINMLDFGGVDVRIYTKILKKDKLLSAFDWANLDPDDSSRWAVESGTDDCDALVVLNGNVNFFGGAEDRAQLYNYVIINNFKGPVFYIYCDPELTLKQIHKSVAAKPWGSYWAGALEIKRTDITYICQPYDVDKLEFSKNEVVPAKLVHFPLEQFPCLNGLEQLPFNPNPTVDLSYGGTMRGGKRIKKMLKFYFGHPADISVEMFGKIKSEDFDMNGPKGPHSGWLREPIFSGPVKYADMLPKMNQSMAHCVIGDPYYEEINDIPQRAYESIWSSVVTFVDADMDKQRRIYGRDRVLSDFLYVKDREELSEKIQLLKGDVQLRQQIVDDQFKAIDFNDYKYCKSFVELLK